MKYNITSSCLMVAAIAAVIFAGCQKETSGKLVTLGVTTEDNGSKMTIHNHTIYYTPLFENNDTAFINDANACRMSVNSEGYTSINVTEADSYTAIYPASIVNSSVTSVSAGTDIAVTLPTMQTYTTNSDGTQKVSVPMGAYSTGTALQFKFLCSLLKVTVNNTNSNAIAVRYITVSSSTQALCGSGTVNINASTFNTTPSSITLASNSHKAVSLYMGANGVSIDANTKKEFYIVIPSGITPSNLKIYVQATTGSSLTDKYYYTYTKTFTSSSPITRSQVATTTIPMSNKSKFGLLGGEFSVGINDDGTIKKVRFSSGNINYHLENLAYYWYFEPNQYSYNTDATSYTSGISNDFSHFGWSTDGSTTTRFGASLSTVNSYYAGNFSDWGNAASFLASGYWYTMPNDEWNYLLSSRNVNGGTCEGHSYQRTTLTWSTGTTVYGLILVPDSYSGSPALSSTTSWADWKIMESVGCVFLPAAGKRFGSTLSYEGNSGYYWSATPYDGTSAYYLGINDINLPNCSSRGVLSSGYSVRLVLDVDRVNSNR